MCIHVEKERVACSQTRSYFVIFSLEEDVMEDIAQGEDSLELEVLVHNYQTVDSGFADGVEDGV